MMACSQIVTQKRGIAQSSSCNRCANVVAARFDNCLLARLGLFAACLALTIGSGIRPAAATAVGSVTITNVIADTDSVKVQYAPVAGAADYRIFNANDPTFVKYAGTTPTYNSNGNFVAMVPVDEIDWNGLTPGVPVTLIVEAVNALGPTAEDTLANSNNAWLYPDSADPMGILGSNQGMTLDGNESINGQGPVTDNPQVIAQSAPLTATPSGLQALPSSSGSTQVVFDNFASGTITQVGTPDPSAGTNQLLMQSDVAWDIFEHNADVTDSKVFIMNRHVMDVLYDGGDPTSNNPLHVGHGALAYSPQQTVSVPTGQILHVTMEVDAHFAEDARRWCAFNLAPANESVTSFDFLPAGTNGAIGTPAGAPVTIDATNQAFFVQPSGAGSYATDVYGEDSNGNATDVPLTGAAGQAAVWAPRGAPYGPTPNGRGIDDRTRFDLFVSSTYFQLYEDGKLATQSAITGGLSWLSSPVKVYFTHYIYHSALMQQELASPSEVPGGQSVAPYETWWINSVPFSDERHWDNMGFEVLPTSATWSNTRSFIGNFTPTTDGGNSDVITSISPNSAQVGASATTLTVNGSGFSSSSVVDWNGTPLATTYVSAAELTATIPAADMSTEGTESVTVATGTLDSNTATFTLAAVPISITGLTLSQGAVTGGTSVMGNLTFSGAIPAGGATVTLSSSNTSAATVPASITFAAGATSGSFTITTASVSSSASANITASLGSSSETAALTVTAAGNGGGSGGGSGGGGPSGTGDPTVAGTITSYSISSNGEAYVTVSTASGSVKLRTAIGVPVGMAQGCYLAKSLVGVSYATYSGDPNAVGRITKLSVGTDNNVNYPANESGAAGSVTGNIISCEECDNVEMYVVVSTASGDVGLRTANNAIAASAAEACTNTPAVVIKYTAVSDDAHAIGKIVTISAAS
jgi:hypothetical protein